MERRIQVGIEALDFVDSYYDDDNFTSLNTLFS